MSSDLVSPLVSWASNTVLSSPGLPLMSKCCNIFLCLQFPRRFEFSKMRRVLLHLKYGERRQRFSKRLSTWISYDLHLGVPRPEGVENDNICWATWTGARRRGPQPPPLPNERTRSRSSFRSSSLSRRVSMAAQPLRRHMFPCKGWIRSAIFFLDP